MNRILKNTFRMSSFLIILMVLLMFLSTIFEPKGNSKEDGMIDYSANGILAETKNSIDTLIVGDSESYSSFIPLKIWKDTGIKSYVCGTPGQPAYYSEEFLNKALKTQKPKLVIFETDVLFRSFKIERALSSTIENRMSIFRYHDRWKKMTPRELAVKKEYTYIDPGKGYRYRKESVPVEPGNYMKKTKRVQPIPEEVLPYFKRMVNTCKERNIKFVMLSVPSSMNYNYAKHNALASLAKEVGVDYIDMNLNKKVGIDWKVDTRDGGDHLNHKGALKATKWVEGYLCGTKLFTDRKKPVILTDELETTDALVESKRNDDAYWNESLDKFLLENRCQL